MDKKIKRIIQIIMFISIICAFIYIGTKDFTKEVIVDNERFDQDYKNVSKDNVFVYANANDIYTVLKGGTGIIFMGFKENVWSGYYANILNETAKKNNVEKILYYDFLEDRNNKNATYQSIVLKLSNYVPTLDSGKQDIYAPTLVMVKNGEIIAYDATTSINKGTITPETYWNEYNVGLKENELITMFQNYLK